MNLYTNRHQYSIDLTAWTSTRDKTFVEHFYNLVIPFIFTFFVCRISILYRILRWKETLVNVFKGLKSYTIIPSQNAQCLSIQHCLIVLHTALQIDVRLFKFMLHKLTAPDLAKYCDALVCVLRTKCWQQATPHKSTLFYTNIVLSAFSACSSGANRICFPWWHVTCASRHYTTMMMMA